MSKSRSGIDSECGICGIAATGSPPGHELYQMKADVFKALAHPLRVAIAEMLRDGEQCVCRIAELLGAERSNISRHLALMVRAGILAGRKDGQMVFYSLSTPCVLDFIACIDNLLTERLKRQGRTLNISFVD